MKVNVGDEIEFIGTYKSFGKGCVISINLSLGIVETYSINKEQTMYFSFYDYNEYFKLSKENKIRGHKLTSIFK